MYLTPAQRDDLHTWIAQGLRYGPMKAHMLNTWGHTVTSAAVSQHRTRFADDIARRRDEVQREAQRRERDRQRKAATRSGMHLITSTIGGRHCATCRCTGPNAA
jgi:hypothetical protein